MIDCSEEVKKAKLTEAERDDLVFRVNQNIQGKLTREEAIILREDLLAKYETYGNKIDINCPGCNNHLYFTFANGATCRWIDGGCGESKAYDLLHF